MWLIYHKSNLNQNFNLEFWTKHFFEQHQKQRDKQLFAKVSKRVKVSCVWHHFKWEQPSPRQQRLIIIAQHAHTTAQQLRAKQHPDSEFTGFILAAVINADQGCARLWWLPYISVTSARSNGLARRDCERRGSLCSKTNQAVTLKVTCWEQKR